MTILMVVMAIILIMIIPSVLYIRASNSNRKVLFIMGVIISAFGVLVSEWLCNIYQLFSDYPESRFSVFLIMAVVTVLCWVLLEAKGKIQPFEIGIYWCIVILVTVTFAFVAPYLPTEDGISEKEKLERKKYQQKIEVTSYTQTERIELLSLNFENDNEEGEKTENTKLFIGVDRGNKVLYWCFFYRNDKGTLEMYCLDDKKLDSTEFFETLEPGEEPYLQIVTTVEVKTDNNYSPVQKTENVIKTEYHLYTTKDYLPGTIFLNFN